MASFSRSSSSSHGHGAGSPCGACKFLRRKCTVDCIFAPYFHSEQEPTRFAAIHKIFGASNASKLLQHVPPADRFDAVSTIAYEAQARMQDPVYGCVSHIFALQHQVVYLQAQLMQVRAQLAQKLSETQTTATPQSPGNGSNNNITIRVPFSYPTCDLSLMNSASHQSSSDHLVDKKDDISMNNMQGIRIKEDRRMQCLDKGMSDTELGDLQELAFRLMKD